MIKNIAVKINNTAEQYVTRGHPWIYSDSIIKIKEDAKTGDLAIVFSKKNNEVIGIGLYDGQSPIRIKMVYNGTANPKIDDTFFRKKIQLAFNKRVKLFGLRTNSYRLLFGENDGFPGLIADVYDRVLVVKLYTDIWVNFIETLLADLQYISDTKTVVIRLSRNLQKQTSYKYSDGHILVGQLDKDEVEFIEHGVRFSANVIKGHKTGYFLDHRENRRLVGKLSKGKTVLDVFSYAGGFSVHALTNGAKEVTSVDISKQALQIAELNAGLNKFTGVHHTIAADAFELMSQLIEQEKRYDIVVIDPPSFAKQQSEISMAKKKYRELAVLGTRLTAKNGFLVLASCSSRITAQVFFDLTQHAIRSQNRPFKIINTTTHDIDHPVSFAEGAYLKTSYFRMD